MKLIVLVAAIFLCSCSSHLIKKEKNYWEGWKQGYRTGYSSGFENSNPSIELSGCEAALKFTLKRCEK